jgi:hypothetical protein
MSFGSNGWIGCIRCGKFNCKFFVPKVARNGPPVRVAPLFRRNRNSENATNMSFGSNRVDWVRSLRKIQLQDFSFQKWLERLSRASSRRCSVENRNSKKQQT